MRLNNSVFFTTVAVCASAPAAALMPPVPACMDASCAFMAATGSEAASSAAPWVRLVSLSKPTGIQTNRAWVVNGLAARHKSLQCGHCGSKNTYTTRALMALPAENPVASCATAATDTGNAAGLAASTGAGASLQAANTAPLAARAVSSQRREK